MVDDSTLDKLYAKKMELVRRHWSGKHGRVVQGINLITLFWTEGGRHIPLDYRFYEKSVDGAMKNDHFRSMLATAKSRGFTPQCVVFDGWYSSLENLKLIREYGWTQVNSAQTQSARQPRQYPKSSVARSRNCSKGNNITL